MRTPLLLQSVFNVNLLPRRLLSVHTPPDIDSFLFLLFAFACFALSYLLCLISLIKVLILSVIVRRNNRSARLEDPDSRASPEKPQNHIKHIKNRRNNLFTICYERWSSRKWSSTLSGIRLMPLSDRICRLSWSSGSRQSSLPNSSFSSCFVSDTSCCERSSVAEKSKKHKKVC